MSQTTTDQGKASQEFEAAIQQAQQQAAALANQTQGDTSQSTQTTATTAAPPVQKVKVGNEEYEPDQLTELVQKGKTVKEWETQKPGYNLDSLYADYTRKSQELAELKRQQTPPEPEINLAPEEEVILKKAVNPIIEQALQRERDRQALELFKKSHSEYNESSKWQKFVGFFNTYYKLPITVESQLQVLEMAHQNMNFEAEVKKKAQQEKGVTLANIQKLEMASVGGGGQKAEPNPHDQYTPEQLAYLKDWGLVK